VRNINYHCQHYKPCAQGTWHNHPLSKIRAINGQSPVLTLATCFPLSTLRFTLHSKHSNHFSSPSHASPYWVSLVQILAVVHFTGHTLSCITISKPQTALIPSPSSTHTTLHSSKKQRHRHTLVPTAGNYAPGRLSDRRGCYECLYNNNRAAN
jgi:hypothetical protein